MAKKANNNGVAILTHILGLIIGFLGPLIVLLASKDVSVKNHAKYALNWQLSVLIYAIISGILVIVLIGLALLPILALLNLIFCIMAAVKASNGELWKYPLSIQFLKI